MPRGSPSPKVAITVDAEIHRRVLDAAAGDGVSVSAWLTEAARRRLRIRDGLTGVAEWEAKHGALTTDEMDEARRSVVDLLGASVHKRQSASRQVVKKRSRGRRPARA